MHKQALAHKLSTCGLNTIPKWVSCNADIKEWIFSETQNYDAKNIMERIHIILNGPPPTCEYGNKLQFNTYALGYRSGCVLGNKCKCVSDARTKKRIETLQSQYGVDNVFQLHTTKEKIKQTNVQRYGVEYPAQAAQVQQKNKKSKSTRTVQQRLESAQKSRETSLSKYGVLHHMQLQSQQEIVKSAINAAWGVDFPIQSQEILAKIKNTRTQRLTQ